MRILQVVGALFILISSPAMAKEAVSAWIVAQKSGDVRVIRNGMQPASVNIRASLSPGDVVATGANGRAMLTRGDDYVVVAPASRLALPKEQEVAGFTRLMQQVGTMLYKVKRTGVPHFEVKTPMLAAVVKGTTFTVVVDQKGAAVQVTEGVVEVSSLTSDARRLVKDGMTVYVGRERPSEIIDVKSDANPLPSSEHAVRIEGSGDVSLTTITNLTDGLISEAPVARVAALLVTAPATGSFTSPTLAPAAKVDDLVVDPEPITDLVGDALTDTLDPVLSVVETAAPSLNEPVTDLLETTVTDPLVDLVDTTVPAVTEPVAEVVETMTDPVAEVAEPVTEVVETVLEPVVDVVETVVDPITDVVETVVEPVTEVIEPGTEVVETVVDPVTEVVETVVEPVSDVVETVVEPVVEAVETVVDPVIDAVEPVTDVVETVVEPVTEVVEPVTEVVETVIEPVTEVVEPVAEVVEPVVEIVEPVVEIVDPVVEIVDTTVPAVTDPVVEIVDTTVPAVTDPVVEVVDTTVPTITDPVTEVVETAPVIICTLLCGR